MKVNYKTIIFRDISNDMYKREKFINDKYDYDYYWLPYDLINNKKECDYGKCSN